MTTREEKTPRLKSEPGAPDHERAEEEKAKAKRRRAAALQEKSRMVVAFAQGRCEMAASTAAGGNKGKSGDAGGSVMRLVEISAGYWLPRALQVVADVGVADKI